MKRSILSVLCFTFILFTIDGQSLSTPDGAAGLKFGMSVADVKDVWKAKGNPPEDLDLSKPGLSSLSYYNVTIGIQKFNYCVLKFVSDRLYEISFYKIPERESFALDYYNYQQKILNSEYGQGDSHRYFGFFTDLDTDKDKVLAMRVKDATIATYWSFKDNMTIMLEIESIDDKITVSMQYQSVELFNKAEKMLKR